MYHHVIKMTTLTMILQVPLLTYNAKIRTSWKAKQLVLMVYQISGQRKTQLIIIVNFWRDSKAAKA